MPRKTLIPFVFLVPLWTVASTVVAAELPRPVAPGGPQGAATAGRPCPLFSWSLGETGNVLDLEVYEGDASTSDDQTAAGVALFRVELPGTASSWTPPLHLCLEPGQRYYWKLRSRSAAGAGPWSAALVFEVPPSRSLPTGQELLAALTPRLEGSQVMARPDVPTSEERARRAHPPEPTPVAVEGPTASGNSAIDPRSAPLPPAIAAIVARMDTPTGVVFGVHGRSSSPTLGSGGVRGENRATDFSASHAVFGRVASPDGAAGVFENTAPGGALIVGLAAGTEVLRVAADGVITATSFSGDGSQILGATASDVSCVGCVDNSELAANSVGAAQLLPNSVGGLELAAASVGASEVQTGAVTREKLTPSPINGLRILSNAVGGDELTPNSIDTEALVFSPGVSRDNLAADAVTRSKIEGVEVSVYSRHDDCVEAGKLTLSSTCSSGQCAPASYFNCSHACTLASPLQCSNTHEGYLLDPS